MAFSRRGAEIRNLTVMLDGERLSVEKHTPRDLTEVLTSIGSKAIVSSIETSYDQVVAQNPTSIITRPSIYAIHIGETKSTSLSEYGRYNRTGIFRSVLEARPEHRDYWAAVEETGFTPHIRRSSLGKRDSYDIMLRNPETDPIPVTPLEHLPAALGFVEPGEFRNITPKLIEAHTRNDAETYRTLWEIIEDEGERAVDQQVESYDERRRGPAQIGKIIANANLRVKVRGIEYVLDENGYIADLSDAETYAYMRGGLDDISALIQTEIDRVNLLRIQH